MLYWPLVAEELGESQRALAKAFYVSPDERVWCRQAAFRALVGARALGASVLQAARWIMFLKWPNSSAPYELIRDSLSICTIA